MSNGTTTTGTREETYERCVAICQEELSRPYPNLQAAQVYATLSLEAAVRDLARHDRPSGRQDRRGAPVATAASTTKTAGAAELGLSQDQERRSNPRLEVRRAPTDRTYRAAFGVDAPLPMARAWEKAQVSEFSACGDY